jgi:D-alanyl-D-alanine carboxypeptidase
LRRLRPILLAIVVTTGVVATAPPTLAAPPKWVQRIDDVVGKDAVSVTIGYEGTVLYRHKDWVRRAPASNEKLLLSMALLDQVPPDTTIPTRVLATKAVRGDGTLRGDLWIVGHGDPETDRRDLAALAADLRERGVERVRGRVMGSTGPFGRDWFAPGWKSYFPRYYIALPTALTYHYNRGPRGTNIRDPERRAAAELTKQLQQRGIKVRGKPGMGVPPGNLVGMATRLSEPFVSIMRRMNVFSSNFRAEVFGKFLGARVGGRGTIARGARAIEAFTRAHGVGVEANDGSGLSYANRVSTEGIVDLLWVADASPWGETLRGTLAQGGQGTLEDRLRDVRIRAKTGTLTDISALSGWVWLEREDAWAEFSILSQGMSKTRSIQIENAIVRVVNANAAPR